MERSFDRRGTSRFYIRLRKPITGCEGNIGKSVANSETPRKNEQRIIIGRENPGSHLCGVTPIFQGWEFGTVPLGTLSMSF
jgi:hypothetical protein